MAEPRTDREIKRQRFLERVREARTVRSCNRHTDCDRAEREIRESGRQVGVGFHCHDECCEDCFGS